MLAFRLRSSFLALIVGLAVAGCHVPTNISCPGGQLSCNGACIDVSNDNANCGACGAACAGGTVCSGGKCGASCASGAILCSDGKCHDLTNDNASCGVCGTVCAAGTLCSAGKCAASCLAGTALCGDGRCHDLDSDNANCGNCGSTCPPGNVCSNGVCALSCQSGLTNCNGTCVDTKRDDLNCGGCGQPCAGGQLCSMGQCALSCLGSEKKCNGTCADLKTDNNNCGGCGTVCPGGTVCNGGACSASCASPYTTCPAVGTNPAYCADLQHDPANCGTCGGACPTGQVCQNGQCAFTCAPGQMSCSGVCANIQTDNSHCGRCTTVCGAGEMCSMGACGATCASPLFTCPAVGANAAYCADTQGDPANCGGCGKLCGVGQTCRAGVCADVCTAPGDMICSGACVQTRTDNQSCGSCGNACPLGMMCSGGSCSVSCASPYMACPPVPPSTTGYCASFANDPQNCGACGKVCPTGQVCSSGLCVDTCTGSTDAFCRGTCVDTRTDVANCGACGNACDAVSVCSNGKCASTCATPLTTCPAVGTVPPYCANTQSDVNNCGACGTPCATGKVCQAGTCVDTCTGTSNRLCAGTCVDLASDDANCGSCGNACAAGKRCMASSCVQSCSTGQTACPTASPSYCATLASDGNNCGACGVQCPAGQVCSSGACVESCAAGTSACVASTSAPELALWPFDGNLKDYSGNLAAGTNNGATFAAGVMDRAIATSPSAFATMPSVSLNNRSFSVELWANGQMPLNADASLLEECPSAGSSAPDTCFQFLVRQGKIDVVFYNDDVPGASTVSSSVWHHLAVTYDATTRTRTVYLDGKVDGTSVGLGSLAIPSPNVMTMGRAFNGSFTGLIDQVKIYSTVRSASDIAADAMQPNSCVNEQIDVNNCGACNAACPTGTSCVNGACQCPGSMTLCSGACVSTQNDPANCGSCGSVCTAGANASPVCTSGVCSYACSPGFTDCDGRAANGCEVQLQTDSLNCGRCGNVCATGTSCISGRCVCGPTAGLVAYLPFDGNTNDASGNNHNATASNVTPVPGKVGGAFQFNTTSVVRLTGPAPVNGPRTLCAWVQPQPTSAKGQPVFTGGTTGNADLFDINASSPTPGSCPVQPVPNELFVDNYGRGCERSGLTAPPGGWSFVCWTWDGNLNVQVYANGSAAGVTPQEGFANWDVSTLTVGSETVIAANASTTAGGFTGLIDEPSLWSRQLSATEIQQLYNSGNGCPIR